MQEAEEAATEAEAERGRRFRLESQRGIVELKLLQRGTQILEVLRLNRINTREHHRLHFLESGYGILAQGRLTWVMVSPTFTSFDDLMPEMM